MTPPPADYPLQYGFPEARMWWCPVTPEPSAWPELHHAIDFKAGGIGEQIRQRRERMYRDQREHDLRMVEELPSWLDASPLPSWLDPPPPKTRGQEVAERAILWTPALLSKAIDREREAAKAEGAKEEREACANVVIDSAFTSNTSDAARILLGAATAIRARE